MDKKSLGYIAIGIIVLMMIVVMVGGGGLPNNTRALVEQALQRYEQADSQFASSRNTINDALQAETALFEKQGYATIWPQRLQQDEQALVGLAPTVDRLKTLTQENDKDARVEVEQLAQQVINGVATALKDAADMANEANRWLDLKRNLAKNIAQMAAHHATVTSANLAPVTERLRKAQEDWPEKKTDLEGRLAALTGKQAEAAELWATTEDARTAAQSEDEANIDYVALGNAMTRLSTLATDMQAGVSQLDGLIGQLYYSFDKLLVDIEIREGADVEFFHKYQTVKDTIKNAAATDESGHELTTTEEWVKVTEADYKKLKDHLGMVIAHKDAGKFDHEATNVAQPPGYAYMAPPGQSNRYGRWENRGGSSFWVFYGQYALMRDVFWGRGSRNYDISSNDYGRYDTARRGGSTYWGNDGGKQRYGSKGTLTAARYSSSKYVRTGGYKSSKYVSSGGSYKGSRYSSSRSRSSGRSSYSSGRSGSRSFGGK